MKDADVRIEYRDNLERYITACCLKNKKETKSREREIERKKKQQHNYTNL